MEQWQQFFAIMAALSTAATSITENITKKLPFLAKDTTKLSDESRSTWIHFLCGSVGAALAYSMNFHPFLKGPVAQGANPTWQSVIEVLVIGVMISYGGSFFNDALDVLKSFASAQTQLKKSLESGTTSALPVVKTQPQMKTTTTGEDKPEIHA